MVKWVLINRTTNIVRTVIHSADDFIDTFIKETFGEEFLCIRETEHEMVGPGWLYIQDDAYGQHHYQLPPRNQLLANKVAEPEEEFNDSCFTLPKRGSTHMKLEAVIICKDYSDFLAHTLPENLQHFDDVVVVTHPDDKKTQAICKRNSVECVKTTVFNEYGDRFNKGKAINLGLSHLRKEDWIIHLDADIVLPHRFRHMLHRAQLDPKNIYGADRINVYGGYENWEKVRSKLAPHYSEGWFVDPGFCHQPQVPEGTKLGARIVHMEHGWVPIGFFQLFHRNAGAKYNYKLGAAAGSDVVFPTQWARENRVLLPEVVCYHLDSESVHHIGINWAGRKSKKFCKCHS